MRVFELTEINPKWPTLILLNGGGQRPYTQFHKATRLFRSYQCNLVSVELPGHGKSGFGSVLNASAVISRFSNEFSQICSNYHQVGLFGFSLGALFALKATELDLFDYLFIISLGAAMIIDHRQEAVMKRYTTMEFFEQMEWEENMLDYHDNWQNLVTTISDMLHVGSPLFANFKPQWSGTPIHIILGDKDEVADYQLQLPLQHQYKDIDVHVLENTTHFDYFTKSFNKLEALLDTIIPTYLSKK